jgi:hypothetical protein
LPFKEQAMTTEITPVAAPPAKSAGRGLYWAGIAVFVLAIAANVGQFAMHIVMVPWYLPALFTLGSVLLLASIVRRRGVLRILTFGLLATLTTFTWVFFISLSRLPAYEGPATVGQKMPEFQTALADGKTFSNKSLEDGQPTVMTFFRGRW